MTPKQRMIAALAGREVDAIPAAPVYLGLFLEDFERAYYIEQYRLRMKGRSRYPVDHAEDVRLRAQACYQAYGIFKQRPDWMEVGEGPGRAWADRTDIVSTDGVLHYHDRESGQRLPMHATPLPRGDAPLVTGNPCQQDVWDHADRFQTTDQVDAQLPVNAAADLVAGGSFGLAQQVMADYGDRFFITTILDPPYSALYDLLGFQGLMLTPLERPRLFHHMLQRQLECCRQVAAAWAATGVHGVFAQEIFTGADIISPRAYDEFVFAYNRPYFEHVRGRGLLPIHYVCGAAVPRLERIVQMDIAAVALEESKKDFVIDIDEVVRRVDGRTAVFGNIDAVRFGPGATLEAMAAETRRQMRSGARANGFVASTGSPFPLDTNPRLIDTLVATAHAC